MGQPDIRLLAPGTPPAWVLNPPALLGLKPRMSGRISKMGEDHEAVRAMEDQGSLPV